MRRSFEIGLFVSNINLLLAMQKDFNSNTDIFKDLNTYSPNMLLFGLMSQKTA